MTEAPRDFLWSFYFSIFKHKFFNLRSTYYAGYMQKQIKLLKSLADKNSYEDKQ
jgi:hypothetical protein